MNKDIVRYRRLLKRNLRCSRVKRQELLKEFSYSLSRFMDECPEPTYSQLVDAFGPPEVMATVMMENVSEEEQKKYRKTRLVFKTVVYIALVLFVAFALYIFFDKEYSVIVIYDELAPVQAIIGLGGYWK